MKALRLVVLVLGPIALVAGVYATFFRSKAPVASSVYVCDVLSGETRRLSLRTVKVFPAPNKDGALSLYPVNRDEDGGYSIIADDRYRELLKREFGTNKSLRVDLSTYRVITPVEE